MQEYLSWFYSQVEVHFPTQHMALPHHESTTTTNKFPTWGKLLVITKV